MCRGGELDALSAFYRSSVERKIVVAITGLSFPRLSFCITSPH
jgi:hypothetical protein